MAAHSTVTYVEPNSMTQDWQPKDVSGNSTDNFERAPRLEDYCIAMNIEVEVSSRDSQGSIKDGDKEVLVLQWSNGQSEKVSFMSGTKIGGYDYDGLKRTPRLNGTSQNLTTYYADMYVGDLIHYGTTEMIGIKSVNIEYAKSCVPIITVQFTDVRGLSLFQPTELSRDNTYNGIKGLNKDNVAQSFFQCFFKMPLPKFTIYIKGFYGNPVAYEVMCDKFDTNFNSDTGDFDVTARFIGYSYSFMTDVSFDALLAAPYSDFFGKKYWDEQVNSGRFYLWDKLKTHKMPMPTLYEIHSDFKRLIQTSDEEMEKTTLTEEESTHAEEIAKLKDIREKYGEWYTQLFDLLKLKFGKRYCFDFKENLKEDADWYRILILTNSKNSKGDNLKGEYEQFSDSFKQTNDNLYAKIEEFNNSENGYKKLENISKDFSKYSRVKLFNDCYVNRNTRKIEFGGFHRDNKLNRVQITNRLFHEEVASSATYAHNTIKEYTLSTIYGDGVDQYKDAYLIEVDYSDLKRRINILEAHANKSTSEKEKEKARKEHNRIMLGKMNWYPSIENFTKVMMAHLETFMMMMYNVAESCSGRKPEKLGVSIGKDGNACDVNKDSSVVPPFPRVVKNEIGEDGITKTVDTWVGEYDNGEGFIEADMINGLFNAVEFIQQLVKQDEEQYSTQNNVQEDPKPIVKHPLTSYDFFLTSKPYGTDADVSNNPNAFASKIAMRMFDILSINNFKKQYPNSWSNSNPDFVKALGTIEAENFYDNVKLSNGNLLKMLGTDGDNGTIDANAIIACVMHGNGIGGNNDIPWFKSNDSDSLFDSELWLTRYSTSFNVTDKTYIYPIQNMSFSSLEDTLNKFNKDANSMDKSNNDIIINWISANDTNTKALLSADNKSCFGSVYIIDDYTVVSKYLDASNTSADDSYKTIYDLIHEDSVFNGEKFKDLILENGVFRPKQGVKTINKYCTFTLDKDADSLWVKKNGENSELQCAGGDVKNVVKYSFDVEKLGDYVTGIENGNISSWFLSECRGFLYNQESKKYFIDKNSSLFEMDTWLYYVNNNSVNGYRSDTDKWVNFFLMGLEAIDYSKLSKILDSNATFTYMPKLAVLQMGAALSSLTDMKAKVSKETLMGKMPLPRTFEHIIEYLNKISFMTRVAYVKYFKDWVLKYSSELNKTLIENKSKNKECNVACYYRVGDTVKRNLFREDSEFTNRLTNELMGATLVAKGNVNHYKNYNFDDKGLSRSGLTLNSTAAINYLDAFLKRLRELYGVKDENKGGDAIKQAKSPSKTTEDMKKELYRYLKLVYDKWIPSNRKECWKYLTFFGEEDCEGNGHLFHFIDSFYNKIGDKLLINPMKLSQKLDAALKANDVNTMMLGFMADIYSQNKCMLMSLQNFMDFGEKNKMETMFTPIPYNEMSTPHKHPDFVVVYPYEPSKYLNVDNGEFNNDAFMLNDEFDTPLAVKSREIDDKNTKCYRIPAFGVSYGKQYQSYFKRVKVGMANPIATQQSIMAKHAILRASQDGSTKTTVAQDMYDIYTTQSYTCTVEMMGCAWVQPLMYFVLTNVPMFRGSYLIFKVNHKITPGNMVTEFQGTRMANVSNKLVEDIFTDEDWEEASHHYEEAQREAIASIDNDCPYKVYPLFDNTSGELTGDMKQKAKTLMDKIASQIYNSDCSNNQVKIAAAGIVGNMYCETSPKFDHTSVNGNDKGYIAGGLCQWNDGYYNLTNLLNGKTSDYGQKKNNGKDPLKVKDVKSKLAELGVDHQIKFIGDTLNKVTIRGTKQTYSKDILSSCTTARDAAKSFEYNYERSDGKNVNDRMNKAEEFYNAYDSATISNSSQPNQDVKKDIYTAFFNAVQKSINSTTNACQLKKEMYIKPSQYSDGIMMIKGDADKLPIVFDIILNGYYEYVQKLWWVYPENGLKGNPSHIDVTVVEKVNPQNRVVLAAETKKIQEASGKKFGSDNTSVNDKLLKSILKKYKQVPNNEIPQFDSQDIFKDVQVQDCNTAMNSNSKEGTLQKGSESVKGNAKITIDGWDVEKSVQWIINNALPPFGQGKCAEYVERAIAADNNGPLRNKISCSENGAPDNKATNLRYYGILEKHGFVKIYETSIPSGGNLNYSLQAGDIAIIGHNGHGKYHACMWTGDRWYSDHKQNNMISSKYPKSDSPYPVALYRYKNKKGTPKA